MMFLTSSYIYLPSLQQEFGVLHANLEAKLALEQSHNLFAY